MMSKKIVSILLMIAITTSLLTGCKKEEDLTGTGHTSEQEVTQEDGMQVSEKEVTQEDDMQVSEKEALTDDAEYEDSSNQDSYGNEPVEEDSLRESENSMNRKEAMPAESWGPDYQSDMAPYPTEEYYSSEEYSDTEENPFYTVKENPLSTFSADVDTASYTNIRRMLKEGYSVQEIPSGAVRIEEMLNYFSYDLKKPEADTPFAVTTQAADCPWNTESELLMVGISTKEIDFSEAKPSNLVFLLDVSGSMDEDDKLPLLQKAFSMLADHLTSKDRVSIVTYANDVEVVLEGANGNDTDRILAAINDLTAEGGTNGGDGIQTAYELAEANFIEGGNNRVILATDGDLNIGLTSEEELEELIVRKKESGVYLSVLGFGTGNIKDNKMELLADKGNGNYSYIDSQREAKKVLVNEIGATLMTVAKDVKFQVEFNPDTVESYRLIGYENRVMDDFDFQDDTKDAGEIGAGHSMIALYEIVPAESVPYKKKDSIKLKYQDDYVTRNSVQSHQLVGKDDEYCTVKIRYKEPDGRKSKESEYPVKGSDYTDTPSEDFQFAACVAQFGMLLKDSKYAGNSSLEDILDTLSEMNLEDEYKMEFYYLVKMAGNYR